MGSSGTQDPGVFRFENEYDIHTLIPKYFSLSEKSSGQYMITNVDLLDKLIESSGVRPTDTVLELGSGSGSITSRLLPLVRKVYVSESDPAMSLDTMARAASQGFTNIELLEGSALTTKLPKFDVCISNLPYALSAPIVFKLIAHRPLWRSSLLIVQREFADALIAEPGERSYSRLSMNASVFVRSERVHRVNGACFYPVPPIESAVVRLTPRNPPPMFDFKEFDALTRTAFIDKRKNLKTVFSRPSVVKLLEVNYKNFCSFNRVATTTVSFPKYLLSVLESVGLDDYPVKQLPPEAMEALLLALHQAGIYFTNIASIGMPAPGAAYEENAPEYSEPSYPAQAEVTLHQDDSYDALPVVS